MTLDNLILQLTELRSAVGKDVEVEMYDPDGNGYMAIEDISHMWAGNICTRLVLNPGERECDVIQEKWDAEEAAMRIINEGGK